MSDVAPVPAPKKRGIFKTILIWTLGLGGGAFGTYSAAVFDKLVKPPLPVANFAASADGLTVTFQNHASGDTGWWDFGDGSPLEPFAPEQPIVAHNYVKPGSYSVKLIVRNLTSDENDRTVSVDVSAVGKDAPAAPQIAGFSVQPISPATMAPATFRVTADVQNAEHLVWDLGDGRIEVAEGSGKIERLVTFDKPGSFPVQLVAHNGKSAARQGAAVKVDSPQDGTLIAVITIADGGAKVERISRAETLAISAPKAKAASFTKTISARPGSTLVDVVSTKPEVPGVKNLKIAIAADKRSALVAGEWANANASKSGGTDALIPLKLTEERASSRTASVMQATGVLQLAAGGKANATIPLPPLSANLDGISRKIDVEVRQIGTNGKVFVLASGTLVGRGPVEIAAKQVYSPPTAAVTTASYDVDAVKIQFEIRTTATVGRAN